jgi:hypothetical protein
MLAERARGNRREGLELRGSTDLAVRTREVRRVGRRGRARSACGAQFGIDVDLVLDRVGGRHDRLVDLSDQERSLGRVGDDAGDHQAHGRKQDQADQ